MQIELIGEEVNNFSGAIDNIVQSPDPLRAYEDYLRPDQPDYPKRLKASRVAIASRHISALSQTAQMVSLEMPGSGVFEYSPSRGLNVPRNFEDTKAAATIATFRDPAIAHSKARIAFEVVSGALHMTHDYLRMRLAENLQTTQDGQNFISLYEDTLRRTRDFIQEKNAKRLYANMEVHAKSGSDNGVTVAFDMGALSTKLALSTLEDVSTETVRAIALHPKTRETAFKDGRMHLAVFSQLRPLMHHGAGVVQTNTLNGYLDPRFFTLQYDNNGYYVAPVKNAHASIKDYAMSLVGGAKVVDGLAFCAAFFANSSNADHSNYIQESYDHTINVACDWFVPVALNDPSFLPSKGNF